MKLTLSLRSLLLPITAAFLVFLTGCGGDSSSTPNPAGVFPTDENPPVVETPVVETPVVETPVVETPVVETPVVETPVVETPVVETPVVETPVVETPVVETPVVETPVVETPVVETPVVETPVVETPVVETPVVETPSGPILADVEGGPFYASMNNTALLNGPVVGTGEVANSSLRKELSIRGLEGSPVIMERAYATRGGFLPRFVAVLHNVSASAYCFVDLEGVRLTDASGNTNVGELFLEPFATGSLGNFGGQQYTDTCMAPGERVYADTILDNLDFDRIAAVEIDTISFFTVDSIATEKILPTRYELVDGKFHVTVQNQSSATVVLGTFYTYIFLDETGLPIESGLGLLSDDASLLPGEEYTSTSETIPEITGSASTVRIIVDVIEIANPETLATASLEKGMPGAYLDRQTNRMIMYQAKQSDPR